MRTRIGAHVELLPVRRRADFVIALESLAVICRLITKDGSEGIELATVAHQTIPYVMAGLVAEMAEQRAVWLVHRDADLLAGGIIGLGGADRDQAVLVAGHGRLDGAIGLDFINEEIEDEAAIGILVTIDARQVPAHHRVEEMPLRLTDAAPLVEPLFRRGIGHQPVMPAGGAEGVRIICQNGPVADVDGSVFAKSHLVRLIGKKMPGNIVRGWLDGGVLLLLLQRMHFQKLRHEGEPIAAVDAVPVVEMNGLAAMIAFVEAHGEIR